MKKLLVVLGPTSTGKTDFSLELAKKYNGELVSCDSRQVYTGLDIGSGKLPDKFVSFSKKKNHWVIEGIPIWMLDVSSFEKRYSVWEYINQASEVINKISNKNKLPIIVGGTGLYLKALIQGLTINAIEDPELRELLEKKPLEDIQKELQKISPSVWKNLNESERKNKRRLIRKIEIAKAETQSGQAFEGLETKYEILKIGLKADKEVLNKRIDARVVKRVEQGLIEEGRRLYSEGLTIERMKQLGLEYGVIADYLEGNLHSVKEFMEVLQNNIHDYAKRQMTYFKKDQSINWFDIQSTADSLKLANLISDWYN